MSLLLLAADAPEELRPALIASALVPFAALGALIFSTSIATHLLCWPLRRE